MKPALTTIESREGAGFKSARPGIRLSAFVRLAIIEHCLDHADIARATAEMARQHVAQLFLGWLGIVLQPSGQGPPCMMSCELSRFR